MSAWDWVADHDVELAAGALGVVGLAVLLSRAVMPPLRTDVVATLVDGRKRERPRLIVLHSTEGPSAASAASWFASGSSGGSAHVVVGEDDAFRTLPDDADAAGAGDVNPYALHIEFAGFAAWSRAEWLSRGRTLSLGRSVVHAWARMYGIPLRMLSAADLLEGKSGVTTHYRVTQAFGGTHTDPGAGFPLDRIV